MDDQQSNLIALEAVLEHDGYNLVTARSGEEALRHLLRGEFALILLDVLMPGMDGFETAELIRDCLRTRYTPIIFLTAVGTSETHVARGYAVGAVDYLFKPIVPEILQAKVAALVDLHRKTAEVQRQGELLRDMERREHEARLAEAERRLEYERVRQEMRSARRIQQALLPSRPPACPGFDIAGHALLAQDTGGDYFDFLPTERGQLDVVVGDVCGHGFGPALLMAATRAYLRALTLERHEVSDVLRLVNRALAADVSEGRFVTLLYGRLDPEDRTFVHASAGHVPGYVMGADGEVRATLESTAPPLGVLAYGTFPLGPQVELHRGDLLLLYTDGLVEPTNADGEPFGVDRALEVARRGRAGSAEGVLHALRAALQAFTGSDRFEDDVTAVVLIAR